MELSKVTDLIGMTLLAAVWGFTNPWIAKASREKEEIINVEVAKYSFLYFRPLIDLWGHLTNWRFILPFVLNQSASAVFLAFVIKTDLSKAVCTINSLTFLFTALAGHFVFNEKLEWGQTSIGTVLIMAGIWVIHS